jgi:hypothetical protein
MTRFRRSWLKPGSILSDEGFSILPKRDRLVYFEANRKMTVTVDMGVRGFTVFLGSIARWDGDPERTIPSEKKQQIADNIRRALESQGQTVNFLP